MANDKKQQSKSKPQPSGKVNVPNCKPAPKPVVELSLESVLGRMLQVLERMDKKIDKLVPVPVPQLPPIPAPPLLEATPYGVNAHIATPSGKPNEGRLELIRCNSTNPQDVAATWLVVPGMIITDTLNEIGQRNYFVRATNNVGSSYSTLAQVIPVGIPAMPEPPQVRTDCYYGQCSMEGFMPSMPAGGASMFLEQQTEENGDWILAVGLEQPVLPDIPYRFFLPQGEWLLYRVRVENIYGGSVSDPIAPEYVVPGSTSL